MEPGFANGEAGGGGGVPYLHRTRLTNLSLCRPNMADLTYFHHPHVHRSPMNECINNASGKEPILMLICKVSWMETEFVTNLEVDVIRLGLCVLQQNQKQCATFCGKLGKALFQVWTHLSFKAFCCSPKHCQFDPFSYWFQEHKGADWVTFQGPFLLLNIKAGTVPPDTIYTYVCIW